MKQYIFFLIFLSLFQAISTEFNIHSDLILNREPNEWFFATRVIRKNPNYSFEGCKQKWQQRLNKMWKEVSTVIAHDLKITSKELRSMPYDKRFQKAYYKVASNKKGSISKRKTRRPYNRKLKKTQIISDLIKEHSLAQCKVMFCSNMNSALLTTGTGTTFLIKCCPSFFNEETIEYVKTGFLHLNRYFSLRRRADFISYIDRRNLVFLLIATSASYMNHNDDFFLTAILNFIINKQKASAITNAMVKEFFSLRNLIEAVFQSGNPLEVALFLRSNVATGSMNENFQIQLWEDLAHDIEKCYHPEDLEAYYTFMKSILERAERNLTPQ